MARTWIGRNPPRRASGSTSSAAAVGSSSSASQERGVADGIPSSSSVQGVVPVNPESSSMSRSGPRDLPPAPPSSSPPSPPPDQRWSQGLGLRLMARTWIGRNPPRRASGSTSPAAAVGSSSSESQERGVADGIPSSSSVQGVAPVNPESSSMSRSVHEIDGMGDEAMDEWSSTDPRGWRNDPRWQTIYRHVHREAARRTAPAFVRYKSEDRKDGLEDAKWETETEEESTGPFSAAMDIVQKRVASRKMNLGKEILQWTPSNQPAVRRAPPLVDFCLMTLAKHGEEIESLEGIPDYFKHKIVTLLCSTRKMSARILGTYLNGSTTAIHLSDCSWASEEVIQDALTKCNIVRLEVLQLDLCGRSMSDYLLQTTLGKSQNNFMSLVTLSLKGAYRLTDDALSVFAFYAPCLRSIDLGKCSLITSDGIISLSEKLDLVELYIDYCQKIDVLLILPMLEKLEHLEVLSVAGVQTVCDFFVSRLMYSCGCNMRKLVFADCQKLTTQSMRAIGANCPHLCALDLQKLNQLNDAALKYLANGCRSMKKLKLRQNPFSDEAIAAFLEASGGSLTELSLNSVAKVSYQTAVAVALQCHLNLQNLDLSFCRELSDEELGFIVDNCLHLRLLKLFGCSQVTEQFLKGHSNSQVKIIGLTGSILDEVEMPKFL